MLTLTAAPHRIEPGDVLTDLFRVGLALIEVPSPDRLTELMHALGATIVPHPDSRPDGGHVVVAGRYWADPCAWNVRTRVHSCESRAPTGCE